MRLILSVHPAAKSLEPIPEITASIVAHFHRLRIPYEPAAMMKVLRERKPKSIMPYACCSLADLGAREAIPLLKELADFPVQDVKCTSVLAVGRLGGRTATPWLVECLSRKGVERGYVLWALAAEADPAAYPAVLAWFEKHLRSLERNPEGAGHGSVMFAVAYLEQQLSDHPELEPLFERFAKVAPRLPGNIPSQLAHFTTTFKQQAVVAGRSTESSDGE